MPLAVCLQSALRRQARLSLPSPQRLVRLPTRRQRHWQGLGRLYPVSFPLRLAVPHPQRRCLIRVPLRLAVPVSLRLKRLSLPPALRPSQSQPRRTMLPWRWQFKLPPMPLMLQYWHWQLLILQPQLLPLLPPSFRHRPLSRLRRQRSPSASATRPLSLLSAGRKRAFKLPLRHYLEQSPPAPLA